MIWEAEPHWQTMDRLMRAREAEAVDARAEPGAQQEARTRYARVVRVQACIRASTAGVVVNHGDGKPRRRTRGRRKGRAAAFVVARGDA